MQMEWKKVGDTYLELQQDEYAIVIWQAKDGTWSCAIEAPGRECQIGHRFASAPLAKAWSNEWIFNERVRELVSKLAVRLPRSRLYQWQL